MVAKCIRGQVTFLREFCVSPKMVPLPPREPQLCAFIAEQSTVYRAQRHAHRRGNGGLCHSAFTQQHRFLVGFAALAGDSAAAATTKLHEVKRRRQ